MRTMGRKRKSDLGLPPRMHLSDGCYYHVSSFGSRKWTRLDPDINRARLLWAQIENGGSITTGLFTTALDEYLVSKKFLSLAPNTQKQYESVSTKLREFFKGAMLSSITPAHIAIWMDKYPSAVQANTGKAIINNVFSVAVRYGIVNANPAKQIANNEIRDRDYLLTEQQFRAIYSAAPDHVQIAMDIGYLTGSRIQDILDIKLQDVSTEGVYIQQGKTKKKMLFVPSDALNETITRARNLPRPVRGMHLLCDHSGKPYPYATFWHHWTAACEAAGVEGAHFHDIRAKAATDAKEMGLDYQRLLGHTTLAMSDKYIRTKSVQKVASL